MTTKSIILSFLHGETKGKASSLSIQGDKLFNYDTVIAQRVRGVITVNKTRYSQTTTKRQKYLLSLMPNVQTVDNMPVGVKNIV